jgi:hypothetical protein
MGSQATMRERPGSRRRLVRCLPVAAIFLSVVLNSGGTPPEASAATEEEVRAAFLFQLAQYVHWPSVAGERESSPLRFCVLGQDNLTVTLDRTVRGKAIRGRSIVVRRIATIDEMTECHLAFVGFRTEKQIRGALESWSYPPVLLVGETERFAQSGGMVNLILENGRVSFEINVAAAERAHLEFRSQLLRVARIVSSRSGEKP